MIQPATFDELFSAAGWPALFEEYKAEAAGAHMPDVDILFDGYRQLEALGRMHLFTALHAELLVGFITVLSGASLKYGNQPIAFTESIFVRPAHRMTGAGIKLLRAAEAKAREMGAKGLLIGAPFDGPLDAVLPRCGYRATSRIYFKRLADA